MATGSKSKKKGSAKKGKTTAQNTGLYDEVILLLVLAVAVLLFLSNLKLIGSFGQVISSFMFGMFGIVSFLVPFVLFLSAAFYLSNRGETVAAVKITAAVVFVLLLCSFAQLLFAKDAVVSSIGEYYTLSSTQRNGGGLLGGAISHLLCSSIGIVGAYVVLIILLIISFVLITEKSFFNGVKKGGETIYHSARDDAARRREQREVREKEREVRLMERQEQKRQQAEEARVRRTEKKVSGVMADTTLKDKNRKTDDIHEITMEEAAVGLDFDNINIRTAHSISLNADSLAEESALPVPPLSEDVAIHAAGLSTEERTAFTEGVPLFGDKPKAAAKPAEITDIRERRKPKEAPVKEKTGTDDKADISKDIKPDAGYKGTYKFPPLNLLKRGTASANVDTTKQLKETAAKLQQTLNNFGVHVTITDISQGPTVTRYEMQPEQGVKVSKIVGLTDDIKLNMAATDIRIEAPIPGKAAVGIEIPNKENSTVMFRDLIESPEFDKSQSKISFAVGKDIGGQTVVTDIAKMPHLLIAGATGSGKSVCINTLIMSILYKAHPDDVKLIMVDPKVVELSVYNGIPHLMIPVVTDPKKAAAALHWGVSEMTDRYNKFAEFGVRDLKGYNKKVEAFKDVPEEERPKKLPQVVIIVDELADLMMVAPGEVEESICRLAQLARAAGIHLIIATQRPSVDVITGLIKANMPSRIAFSVSSGVDSRTILDMVGAEKLLGKGDMLFYPQGYAKPARIQGAFVSDQEVSDVVDFLKEHTKGQVYSTDIEEKIAAAGSTSLADSGSGSDRDQYFEEAAKFIIDKDKASIGMLQRVFKIGFNRAARIMDQLADAGVVGEEEGTKPRKVLMSMEQFEEFVEESL